MTSMPVAGLGPSRGEDHADLVVRNALIHTGDPLRPAASALTVRGGRIGVVGDDHDVAPHVGPSTRIVDAQVLGGVFTALTAGLTQIGGGLLLAAGAATPLAASMAVGVMTVATTVKWRNGLWAQNNGYEYPAFLALTAACLALTGPGRWSVDEALGRLPWPTWLAVAAIALGAGGGLLTRVLLHRTPPPQTAAAGP
jgi:putative oxidoreductase